MTKVLAVIPARYGATRFPGKPLADLAGKPILQWVYEAACSCECLDEVVVATEDRRIAEAARRFGGPVEMTRVDHETGSDRVAEVAERRPDASVIVNIQGDQPFATAEMLRALVAPYWAGDRPDMTTLATLLADPAAVEDPNIVKVVTALDDSALYFSRSAIPHPGGAGAAYRHHLGLYAFTRETILRFPGLKPTPLERHERLEQLRALEHGIHIQVCVAEEPVIEINTPEDLEAARRLVGALEP